jgi:beta-glucosidase
MPDSHFRGGGKLIEAAKGSKKVEAAVRRSAAKVLGLIKRAGGRHLQPELPERAEDLPEVRNFIRRAGAEGAVLLKNKDSILPLSKAMPIAVTGAFASVALAHGGGSASLNAHRKVSPLDGIRDYFTHIHYAPGAPADLLLPVVSSTPEGETGCVVEFVNPDGVLVETRHLSSSYLSALDRYPKDLQPGWTAIMRLKLRPATSGRHSLQISSPAEAILSIDGRELCRTEENPARRDYFLQAVLHKIAATAEIDMVAGQTYDVSIKYTSNEDYLYATNYTLNGVRWAASGSCTQRLTCIDLGSESLSTRTPSFPRQSVWLRKPALVWSVLVTPAYVKQSSLVASPH